MLRQVLRLAIEQGITCCENLARAMDTSPELVCLALAELARRDYLHAVVPGCSTACEHCPLHAACLHRRHPRVWTLTRKGEAWAAQAHGSRSRDG